MCSDLQKQLCDIYADIFSLPADAVGIHDDFFALGGDSVLAIRLVGEVETHLKINIDVKDIYQNPLLVDLKKLLSKGKVYKHVEPYKKFSFSHMVEGEVPDEE